MVNVSSPGAFLVLIFHVEGASHMGSSFDRSFFVTHLPSGGFLSSHFFFQRHQDLDKPACRD